MAVCVGKTPKTLCSLRVAICPFLFYKLNICSTLAKSRLAVFYNQPSAAVIAKAEEWFGEENMVGMD